MRCSKRCGMRPTRAAGGQFGVESPVIASTGVGADMGELYAAARGVGVKERLAFDRCRWRQGEQHRRARELLDSHGVGIDVARWRRDLHGQGHGP